MYTFNEQVLRFRVCTLYKITYAYVYIYIIVSNANIDFKHLLHIHVNLSYICKGYIGESKLHTRNIVIRGFVETPLFNHGVILS